MTLVKENPTHELQAASGSHDSGNASDVVQAETPSLKVETVQTINRFTEDYRLFLDELVKDLAAFRADPSKAEYITPAEVGQLGEQRTGRLQRKLLIEAAHALTLIRYYALPRKVQTTTDVGLIWLIGLYSDNRHGRCAEPATRLSILLNVSRETIGDRLRKLKQLGLIDLDEGGVGYPMVSSLKYPRSILADASELALVDAAAGVSRDRGRPKKVREPEKETCGEVKENMREDIPAPFQKPAGTYTRTISEKTCGEVAENLRGGHEKGAGRVPAYHKLAYHYLDNQEVVVGAADAPRDRPHDVRVDADSKMQLLGEYGVELFKRVQELSDTARSQRSELLEARDHIERELVQRAEVEGIEVESARVEIERQRDKIFTTFFHRPECFYEGWEGQTLWIEAEGQQPISLELVREASRQLPLDDLLILSPWHTRIASTLALLYSDNDLSRIDVEMTKRALLVVATMARATIDTADRFNEPPPF